MGDMFTLFLQVCVITIGLLLVHASYNKIPIFKKPIVRYGLPVLGLLLLAPLYH